MAVFLILLLLVFFYEIQIANKGDNPDFLTKSKTDAIKGIFIVIVFINHIKEYYIQAGADLSAWYDKAFFLPASALGQLMVVMFLFYSGYGVVESIKKKGE